MIMKNKKYTTGDIARLYGITLDAVRYYEQKGLLPKSKIRESKHRSYERADVILFNIVQRMKRMGIPLADINELIMNNSLPKIDEYCKKHIALLQEEYLKLNGQLSEISYFHDIILQIKKNAGKIFVEESPAFIGKDITHGIEPARQWFIDHFGDVVTDLLAVENRGLQNDFGRNHRNEDFTDRDLIAKINHMYLVMESSEEDFSKCEADFIWPRQTCIHSIIKTRYDKQDFTPIFEYQERHNYRYTGKTLVKLLFREQNENGLEIYYEIWNLVD